MTKSQQHLSQQATLPDGTKDTWSEEWRRECEARDWINRYRLHYNELGKRAADAWWKETKEQILKHRGPKVLKILLDDMMKERDAKGGKS